MDLNKNDLITLAVAAGAVFLILKKAGVTMPSIMPLKLPPAPVDLAGTTLGFQNWYDYNISNDESGALFSATGADVRARR